MVAEKVDLPSSIIHPTAMERRKIARVTPGILAGCHLLHELGYDQGFARPLHAWGDSQGSTVSERLGTGLIAMLNSPERRHVS